AVGGPWDRTAARPALRPAGRFRPGIHALEATVRLIVCAPSPAVARRRRGRGGADTRTDLAAQAGGGIGRCIVLYSLPPDVQGGKTRQSALPHDAEQRLSRAPASAEPCACPVLP